MQKENFCINLRKCCFESWDSVSMEIKEAIPGFFINKEINYFIKFKN